MSGDYDASSQAPALAPTLAPLGGSPKPMIDRIAQAGFRFIQLSASQPGLRPRELDQSGRRDLLASLRRREMTPAGLDLWIPMEHWSDPTRIDRVVESLTGAIALAADLGRIPVSTVIPPDDQMYPDVLESILQAAAHHGVGLADHAVPPHADADRVVGLDPVAWLSQGLDPLDALGALGPRLVSARLADLLTTGERAPLGAESGGRLDVLAYQVGLNVAGYQGPVVLDARQWAGPWAGIKRTATAWDTATR